MSTDTATKTCTSRGPRIGGEGVPLCGLHQGHYGDHQPHPADGWDNTVRWTNQRDRGAEQWVVMYAQPHQEPRAEGPMDEAAAMARRAELFDSGHDFTVQLVRHVPSAVRA